MGSKKGFLKLFILSCAFFGALSAFLFLSPVSDAIFSDTNDSEPPDFVEGSGPYSDTIRIAVSNKHDDKNFASSLERIERFWEREMPDSTGYSADIVLVEDTQDADIVIYYTNDNPCSRDGCSPIIEENEDIKQKPVPVYVEPNSRLNRRSIENIMIHEVGHALGIGHCEDPEWVMGCPNTGEGEEKNVKNSDYAWRESEITLSVDYGDMSQTERDRREERLNDSIEFIETRASTQDREVTIRQIDGKFNSDIHIDFSGCECDGIRLARYGGQQYDDDGNPEYYTMVNAQLSNDIENDEIDYYISLILVQAVSPGDIPEELRRENSDENTREQWDPN